MTVPYSVATPVVPSCVAYISVICLSLLLTAVTRNLAAPYVALVTVTKAVCEVELVVVSLPSRTNVSPEPTVTDPLTSIPDDEVSSFVLPIGATINMDGTAVYQAVAAVFIAQTFGLDLSFTAQLGIISTATLASIGAAAVPSAGIIVLVIVLAQAGIPEAGLALIFAVDRPLDMCRTVVNITGDATVSTIVSKFQKNQS